MNINFYKLDEGLQNEWDTTLSEPLLIMTKAESKDIPSVGEFMVLPVGAVLYKVNKIIRKVDEVTKGHFVTLDIDVVLTPTLID
ncbi:hypothetical protein D8S93_08570 [Vibrio sp. VGrn 2]|uniref:hypothetical protein n=1 Tax=Vibrio TaxID=662 RepID=UPI00111DEC84|nr:MULTISPECIES: hypothetical protein [Vibrio]EJC1447040.1 hypothetical protein [Vibrio parahaemolyticus]EJI1391862.1 hypothetical protein [Vibrio parahaemolyticus]MPS38690.1 hypothetical protein [Vibrio sp. VGrn 2]TOD72938.1 hypothetical protein CGJ61_03465 [Vibrio parahaemolyticus]HCG6643053.1 hypothetical protein [Vibrio parahaemolyticus]